MKTNSKIKLLLSLICMLLAGMLAKAQVLNQSATWPNSNWDVSGSYNTDVAAFEADPRASSSFAFDDQDAGNGSDDEIAAESTVYDLTAAHNAGEVWIKVSGDYTYHATSNDVLLFEYWDADDNVWIIFDSFEDSSPSGGAITNVYCDSFKDPYTSNIIDISGFTPAELSGFKYRIYYNDKSSGAGWEFGFCFSSPRITSEAPSIPPSCPEPETLNAINITFTTADLLWVDSTGSNWDIEWGTSGFSPTETPTIDDNPNNPYSLSGLTENTAYDFYVRSDCNADNMTDLSNWVGPFSFSTQDSAQLNDDCEEAILLTVGSVFDDYPLDASLTNATADNEPALCGIDGPGIWYLLIVPPDGNVTIETGPDSVTENRNFDTVIEAFSESCDNLDSIGCDDDGGAINYSLLDLSGLEPGSTIHVRVWEYGGNADEPFAIAAYNGNTLSTTDSEFVGFEYYPNPVEDILSISAKHSIDRISIINMSGQEVIRTNPISLQAEVDMTNLKTGIYFTKVSMGTSVKTLKIIKE